MNRRSLALVIVSRAALVVFLISVSVSVGALNISLSTIMTAVLSSAEVPNLPVHISTVIFDLRLPRALLAVLVGATLAICGAVMQGMFRNPLADPGIIGVSSGAAVGPNGAGKSTLIKAISQDYRKEGTISLNDEPIAAISSRRRAQHIGVLSQASELSFPFKAWQVVEMGATPLNLSRSQLVGAITRVMKACDCLHLKDRRYPQLSGGEKQRVQLARVLLQLSQAQ